MPPDPQAPSATGNSFQDRAVLVTGGTRGIGRAIGLAFGRRGAQVFLTQKWGSADAEGLRAEFVAAGAPPPVVLDADVAHEPDTATVMEAIAAEHERLDVLISNVAFAPVVRTLEDLTRRGLATALDYSTFPVVGYTLAAQARFGAYPRHVLALSSSGHETYHVGYDVIAAAKAALETTCRYLHHRLRDHGSRVNVLRTRFASTESLRDTFGERFEPFVEHHAPGLFTPVAAIAEAAVGMCSGLMDGVGGQVVTIDRGASITDSFSRLFDERADLPPLEAER